MANRFTARMRKLLGDRAEVVQQATNEQEAAAQHERDLEAQVQWAEAEADRLRAELMRSGGFGAHAGKP